MEYTEPQDIAIRGDRPPWAKIVATQLDRVQNERKVFINPRSQALNYQAALESVGKGLIGFDGCDFYVL